MAGSNVSTVVNYFSQANEGFTTTLGSTITSAATVVPLNSVTGLTNGSVFVGIIEPGLTTQQVFTGLVDTGGAQITGVKWTRGTNVGHSAGVTIVDYVTGTGHNMTTAGLLKEHKQTGAHANVTADSVVATNVTINGTLTIAGNAGTAGWTPITGNASVTTGFNKGGREFLVTTSSDNTALVSAGMRFQITRHTAPPTQCALLNGTNQYANKTSPSGVTFTDDFTVEAWIKVTGYAAGAILSRYNGTSGWQFRLGALGQLELEGFNASAANFVLLQSIQAVPLNEWVHVAATLDMSGFTTTTSKIWIDGYSVPTAITRGGTNPTALVQAGNLELGGTNGGTQPFNGALSDVRLWSAARTDTQIRDNMSITLVGTETNLITYYKLNGLLTDSTSNANALTGQNSAVATTLDNPYNTIEYGIITKVTSSALTIFTGYAGTIPNMTLDTPSFATAKAPFGFPGARSKWMVEAFYNLIIGLTIFSKATASINTWYNGGIQISLPTGVWETSYHGSVLLQTGSIANILAKNTLSTTATTETDPRLTTVFPGTSTAAAQVEGAVATSPVPLTTATTTAYFLNQLTSNGSGTINLAFSDIPLRIQAYSAYL